MCMSYALIKFLYILIRYSLLTNYQTKKNPISGRNRIFYQSTKKSDFWEKSDFSFQKELSFSLLNFYNPQIRKATTTRAIRGLYSNIVMRACWQCNV